MFYYSSLNFARFKWFSMVDIDQKFSPNILPCEQMFDRLAISANKACCKREKSNQSETEFGWRRVIIFSGKIQKALRVLTLLASHAGGE